MSEEEKNAQLRAYVYRVALAILALLVFYGVISGEESAAWAGLIVAILPTVLAVKNTSTK